MATPAPLKVLIHLHPQLDTLDFTGPLEILSHAVYPSSTATASLPGFIIHLTAGSELTTSGQNLTVKRHLSLPEAHAALTSYDVLLIPGGASETILGTTNEPLSLIKSFFALTKKENGGMRYLLSVCTGSLFLAEAGVLDGLAATTHKKYYDVMREVAAKKGSTIVVEDRFVVNPEREGMRVVTSGGVSCGLDSCLWLIGTVAGEESRDRVADIVQYARRDGVVL